jgi:hypothetical protein
MIGRIGEYRADALSSCFQDNNNRLRTGFVSYICMPANRVARAESPCGFGRGCDKLLSSH